MGPSLSAIVASVAVLPTVATAYLVHEHAYPSLALVLGWASATGWTVAICTLGSLSRHTTWLLGKSSDGRIRAWSWVLWWAYHIGLRIKLGVGKAISKEPLYSRILPGWYLGGWPSHTRHLPPGRTTSVIDVTCELPRSHTHKYLALMVWDTCAPTLQQLQQGVEFARGETDAGRSLFIHCAHGHGRSATVMCACLIEQGHASSIEQAVHMLKSARPLVHMSAPQRQVLELWMQRRSGRVVSAAADGLNGPLVIPSSARDKPGSIGLVGLDREVS